MAIFGRYAYAAGIDVLGLLIVRFGIGGVAWPTGHARLRIAAMGALSYVGQSFCYFTALQHTRASLVAPR